MPTEEAPFRMIANTITDQIKSGQLRPGEKLPSMSQLALKYEVSVATVYRAVSLLHERNLIVGKPGKGLYVREPKS